MKKERVKGGPKSSKFDARFFFLLWPNPRAHAHAHVFIFIEPTIFFSNQIAKNKNWAVTPSNVRFRSA